MVTIVQYFALPFHPYGVKAMTLHYCAICFPAFSIGLEHYSFFIDPNCQKQVVAIISTKMGHVPASLQMLPATPIIIVKIYSLFYFYE